MKSRNRTIDKTNSILSATVNIKALGLIITKNGVVYVKKSN